MGASIRFGLILENGVGFVGRYDMMDPDKVLVKKMPVDVWVEHANALEPSSNYRVGSDLSVLTLYQDRVIFAQVSKDKEGVVGGFWIPIDLALAILERQEDTLKYKRILG